MNQSLKPGEEAYPDRMREAHATGFGLDTVRAFLRRRWGVLLLGSLIGLGVGIGLIKTRQATYTSTATILVDVRKIRVLQDAYVFTNDEAQTLDAALASQIELMKSDLIASRLVTELAPLVQDATGARTTDPDETRQAVIRFLRSGLTFQRMPKTYALAISFTSPNAERSARVANAVAEAYLDDQRSSNKEITANAAAWLKDQLIELKKSVQDTEESILKYKSDRGHVTVDGRLVDDQRLADINRQVMGSRAEASNIELKYRKIQAIIADKSLADVPTDLVADPVLNQLKTKFIEAENQERDLLKLVSANHESVNRVRLQKTDLTQLIRREIERLGREFKLQLDIAKTKQVELERSFDALVRANAETSEEQIALRELERRGNALNALYSSVLQQYQAALQQHSFQQQQARIMSRARPPTAPNGPPPLYVLAFALAIGATGAGGLAALIESLDRTFRSRRQVRAEVGIDVIGMVPLVKMGLWQARRSTKEARRDAAERRHTLRDSKLLQLALTEPRSPFVEALQAVRINIMALKELEGRRLIGVVSALPADGKTTLAKSLASLLAQGGNRTLLVDADLRKNALSRQLTPHAEHGLIEMALSSNLDLDRLYTEEGSNLQFLPSVPSPNGLNAASSLASPAVASLFSELEQQFDYVIVDLPPLTAGYDVQAIEPRLDAIVFVARWGQTPRSVIRDVLDEESALRKKCVGIVLNACDMKRVEQYQGVDYRTYSLQTT